MLALDPSWLLRAGAQPGAIRAWVAMSGPYLLVPNTVTLHRIFGPPSTELDWQPAGFVHAGVAPALILHGGSDNVVALAQARTLHERLMRVGVAARLIVYPHAGHAGPIASFSPLARTAATALGDTLAFLDQIFAVAPLSDGAYSP